MTAPPRRPARPASRARLRTGDACRTVLFIDGGLLMLIGSGQLGFELLSHFRSAGPLADRFHGAPYTIGFVEAHGLAAVLGLLLMRSANDGDRRFWHLVAAAIHLLLGGANVLFWDSFVTFDLVGPGSVATAVHAISAAVQVLCVTRQLTYTSGKDTSRKDRMSMHAVGRLLVRHALLLRAVLVATFAAGLALHGLSLVFGRTWLLTHVLTPAVDAALAVPMAYAALAAWVLRRRVVHPSAGHRRVYLAMVGYLAISVPIHLDSLVRGEVRYVAAFPEWYSLVILPVQALLLVYGWRLRITERDREESHRPGGVPASDPVMFSSSAARPPTPAPSPRWGTQPLPSADVAADVRPVPRPLRRADRPATAHPEV